MKHNGSHYHYPLLFALRVWFSSNLIKKTLKYSHKKTPKITPKSIPALRRLCPLVQGTIISCSDFWCSEKAVRAHTQRHVVSPQALKEYNIYYF